MKPNMGGVRLGFTFESAQKCVNDSLWNEVHHGPEAASLWYRSRWTLTICTPFSRWSKTWFLPVPAEIKANEERLRKLVAERRSLRYKAGNTP